MQVPLSFITTEHQRRSISHGGTQCSCSHPNYESDWVVSTGCHPVVLLNDSLDRQSARYRQILVVAPSFRWLVTKRSAVR